MLVWPEDDTIDVKWAEALGKSLNGEPLSEQMITDIVNELNRAAPVAYKDVPRAFGARIASSLLRSLARAMTVQKVQGMSLDKMIFTMCGFSVLLLPRLLAPVADILLAGPWNQEKFLTSFNTRPQ